MKNMNMKKRYWTIDLQVFAEGEEPGGEGEELNDTSKMVHRSAIRDKIRAKDSSIWI